MRRPLLAGNWKMHTNIEDAVSLLMRFRETCQHNEREVLICPPFTHLAAAKTALEGSSILLGAQNMHSETKGAFTGEISGDMLKEFCTHVILGHSERREFLNEDDLFINKKVIKALEVGLKPILCIGETKEERNLGKAHEITSKQLQDGLKGITKEQSSEIIIAYEPVWAISRGDPNVKPANSEDAQEMHAHIREVLSAFFGMVYAQKIRILYGGSVKPENIKDYMDKPDIDGALVGGASLKPSFSEIVNY
jgi:triosephosphate isomerase (TIM)